MMHSKPEVKYYSCFHKDTESTKIKIPMLVLFGMCFRTAGIRLPFGTTPRECSALGSRRDVAAAWSERVRCRRRCLTLI